MKKALSTVSTFALVLLLPLMAFAQGLADGNESAGDFGSYAGSILQFIERILIPFILAIGFIFFVWGMFLYFIKGGSDEGEQEKGKSLMFYALAGFVLILSFWGIINILVDGVGTGGDVLDGTPEVNLIND
jgi:hypothetical protein